MRRDSRRLRGIRPRDAPAGRRFVPTPAPYGQHLRVVFVLGGRVLDARDECGVSDLGGVALLPTAALGLGPDRHRALARTAFSEERGEPPDEIGRSFVIRLELRLSFILI